MKLATIWTLPAMTTAERLRQTADWTARAIASRLPKRIRYWTFIQVGSKAMTEDENIPDAKFMDLLDRAEGGPR